MQRLHRFLLVNRIINRIKIEIRKVFFAINNGNYMYMLPLFFSLSLSCLNSLRVPQDIIIPHRCHLSWLLSSFLPCRLFIRNCSVYQICTFIMHARVRIPCTRYRSEREEET